MSWGGSVVFEWSARKSCAFAQKNFREDENLFFRSVTGLAAVGTARGHCNESAEDALGRTSLPHCNVGCAGTLDGILGCNQFGSFSVFIFEKANVCLNETLSIYESILNIKIKNRK